MSDLIDKTLEEIKKESIKPEPKWHFVCRDCFFASSLIVAILSGSIIFSTICFLILSHDWEAERYMGTNYVWHTFIFIPYFWVFFLVLFLLMGFLVFRNIKKGYRIRRRYILGAGIFIFFFFGATLFLTGFMGCQVHEEFQRFSAYDYLIHSKEDDWKRTDKGLLNGQVVDIKGQNKFNIKDSSGCYWSIEIADSNIASVRMGDRIKLIGVKGPDNIFYVKIIKPW